MVVLFTYIQYLCNLAKTFIKIDSHIAFQFTKRKFVFLCTKKTKVQKARSSLLKGLRKLHWQKSPFQDFMTFLKFERFPAKLRCCGRLFYIFRSSALKLFWKKKWTRLALWSQGIELVGYMQPYLRMIIQRLLDKNPRLVDLVFCKFQ